MNVNYIKHLEAVFDKFIDDSRLTTSHTSLYYSLFHMWNVSKFNNPISICRSEQMRLSKIGSANTYTRCLKQLDEWGYIQYLPSYNPLKGSLVNLYNFDKGCGKGTDKGCSNSSGNSSDNSTVRVVRPSINSLNNTNNKNKETIKQEEANNFRRPRSDQEDQKGERYRKTAFSPPPIEEVKKFFLEIKSTTDQAEQFHNHFESNGWLVGGKAKMKSWEAAARNWVKRSANFKNGNRGSSGVENRLNTNNDKDYSMPL